MNGQIKESNQTVALAPSYPTRHQTRHTTVPQSVAQHATIIHLIVTCYNVTLQTSTRNSSRKIPKNSGQIRHNTHNQTTAKAITQPVTKNQHQIVMQSITKNRRQISSQNAVTNPSHTNHPQVALTEMFAQMIIGGNIFKPLLS